VILRTGLMDRGDAHHAHPSMAALLAQQKTLLAARPPDALSHQVLPADRIAHLVRQTAGFAVLREAGPATPALVYRAMVTPSPVQPHPAELVLLTVPPAIMLDQIRVIPVPPERDYRGAQDHHLETVLRALMHTVLNATQTTPCVQYAILDMSWLLEDVFFRALVRQ